MSSVTCNECITGDEIQTLLDLVTSIKSRLYDWIQAKESSGDLTDEPNIMGLDIGLFSGFTIANYDVVAENTSSTQTTESAVNNAVLLIQDVLGG